MALPGWTPFVGVAAAILLAVPGSFWLSSHVELTGAVYAVALFAHLAALILGFGAVLTVDWSALLWTTGRRSMTDVLDAAAHSAVPIWLGFSGLVLSGAMLQPDPTSLLMYAKLALVMLIGLNGVVVAGVHRALAKQPSTQLVALGMCCAGFSQMGWWGATLVGFINAH